MSHITSLASDLRRIVRGQVLTDDASRYRRARDFGRLAQQCPALVVIPVDVNDVAAVVRYAAQSGIAISTQAAAHSQGGQSLSNDGLLLDMHGFGDVATIDDELATVDVGTGVLWRDVVEATLTRGLVPPVLTDNLFTTVGGTASVGGIGFSSHRYGVQLDQHVALEIVSGDGEIRWCSLDHHADLYLHALGGLGQFGIVTKTRHRLRRHGPAVQQSIAAYRTIDALIDDVRNLTDDDGADFVRAGFLTLRGEPVWALAMESDSTSRSVEHTALRQRLSQASRVGNAKEINYTDFVLGERGTESPKWERDARVVAPGLDLLLPADVARTFIPRLMASLPDDVRDQSKFLLLFLRRSRLTRPMFMTPDTEHLVLLTMEPVMASERATELMTILDNADAHGRSVGGVRYLAGSVRYDDAQWRAHYGAQWDDIVRAKRQWDPHNVFVSSAVRF